MNLAQAIVLLVVAQRLGELAYARRNTTVLKERGGIESGRGHYPIMVLLHVLWLVAVWLGIQRDSRIRWVPLSAFLVLQLLRVWVIATLGRYWTTRVITIPGEPLVRRGPYRFLNHPNYLIVALEMAVFPLVFGQVSNAFIFSALNLLILGWRVRLENRVLNPRRALALRS
jgi:methyltransferase